MRSVVGEITEERMVPVCIDELESGVGQNVCDEALRLDNAPIVFEAGVEVVVPMPQVEPECFLKSLSVRRVRIMLAVVPFAEQTSTIPRLAERLGDRHLFGAHRLIASGDAAY